LFSITLTVLMSLSMIGVNIIEAKDEGLAPGVYTVTIPATLQVKGDADVDVFTISAQWGEGIDDIDIDASSKNEYSLVSNEGVKIGYHIANIINLEKDPPRSFSHQYRIHIDDSYEYAGTYTDTITFSFEPKYNEYDITYYTDGGILTSSDVECVTENSEYKQTYTVEDTVILPTPVKDGCDFGGWYKEGTFENKVEEIAFGDMVLYAKWTTATSIEEQSVEETPIIEEPTIEEEELPNDEEESKQEEVLPEQEIVEEETKEEEVVPEVIENEEKAND
ncbi:MAG: InlB B-repeat-containing protein, partial [Erysipelotrichaceae bacterium]|nr:InlB B-repeat-containing protein [Erysipelotrichaceae bacterium]